jgi:hypothetical protein
VAVSAALIAPAAHHNHPARQCGEAASFRQFSAKVWAPSLWRRRLPSPKILAAKRRQLDRARGCGYRGKLRATWRKDQRHFYRHRHVERSWIGCPVEIRAASESYDVSADLLYGIEGAESSHLGGNWFGLLAGAEGVDVGDRAASAMQAARLMRRLHDELGGWPAAMSAYSGGSYDISHPYALSGDVCP